MIHIIAQEDTPYPRVLSSRLAADAPAQLFALGNPTILSLPKTGLFCSSRCPGQAILAAYDQASQWREEGRCIISGFHSTVEKECLRILLRGQQPIVICPARSIEHMRIPRDWRNSIEAGRLLLVSPFSSSDHRVTATLADRRRRLWPMKHA
jgi:predicted Rossmann fold nucleotide-binding protein DprA/Smf involved in DNA uptake